MLDVSTAIAAAEGRRPGVVGVPVGIPHNVGHLALKLQLVDALGLCRDGLLKLVLLELGKLRINVGVDRAGLLVHLGRQIGRCQPVVAAALCELALDAVAGLQDGGVGACLSQSNLLAQLANVTLHLIAQVADAVADVGQAVVQLVEMLVEQDFLLSSRRCILAVIAGAIAPQAIAAHKDKQEEDDDPPCAALAPTVVIVATIFRLLNEGHDLLCHRFQLVILLI